MGRLYYEKIRKPNQPKAFSGKDEQFKEYVEKVSRLIPSEIIAGYLAMFGFVPLVQNITIRPFIYVLIFLLCQILTPIYLNSQAEAGKPKRNHLILSSIAFIIWAYVTTGSILIPSYYDAALASIMLISFSLISAIIPLKK